MTAKQQVELIGRHVLVTVENQWSVPMEIHDVRKAYGALQYEVSPINGTGVAWVAASRVAMVDKLDDQK